MRLPVSVPLPHHDRHRATGIVRAVARSDPRLCRHRVARPCGVLRRRRLFRRLARAARHHHPTRDRAGRSRIDRGGARFSHQFSGDQGRRRDPADGDAGHRPAAGGAGGAVFRHHRRHRRAARHRHAADPRPVRFRHVRQGRLLLFACRAVPIVPAGAPDRAFAVRPVAARNPQQPAARRRDRHPGQPASGRDLHRRGILRRHRRGAVHPDHGFGLARRVLVRAFGRPDAGAGDRRYRLSLRRIDWGRGVQDAAGILFQSHAAILAILDRSGAGRDRAGRPPAPASLGAHSAQPGPSPVWWPQDRHCRSRGRRVMTFALETRGLEKQFGGLKVTRDLSLQIAAGARHAVIGPNGAGKTTVINLLTGLLKPNAGRILLEGNDITDLPVHTRVLRGLSRTFQINQLYADLTPLETIGLVVSERLGRGADWWRRTGTREDVNAEVGENLSRFHLLDVMNEPTVTLPYGKQRLLEIAVAIATKPRVLLLDEPAAGVPEGERHDILAAVAALPRDVTVLLIEHDMDLVFSFADRISVLVNGALLVEGTPDEVARDARVKAVYLGEAADA